MKNIILLVGNLNNSGDFLIAHRAKELFEKFFEDTNITLINRNQPYSDEALERLYSSDLVVIVGGPCVLPNLAERLFFNEDILNNIKKDMIIFGGGIKTAIGQLHKYTLELTPLTKQLYDKIENSKFKSSTRDLKALYYLKNLGFKNFIFTGCPAMFCLDELQTQFKTYSHNNIKKVVFSVGATGMNKKLFKQQLTLIKKLKNYFINSELCVAFHHSIDNEQHYKSYKKNIPLYYRKLADYSQKLGLKAIDISGSADKMVDLYKNCDLHIGYRVHAHILMTSLRKNSILINEDSKGVGVSEIIQGRKFNVCSTTIKKRLFKKPKTKVVYNKYLYEEITEHLEFAKTKDIILNYLPEQFYNDMQKYLTDASKLLHS